MSRVYVYTQGWTYVLIVLSAALGFSVAMAFMATTSPEGQPVPPAVITEDDPRFDCATMGNGTCGPTHDLTDPFDRCLSAVESAELPAWVWECHQTPAPVIKPQG